MASNATTSANDFAREAVPEQKSSSGLHLALILIGGTIGFSIFIVASQIGGALGYSDGAMAFGIGGMVLGLMGAATSYVGARSRLSTYLLTEFSFGRDGAKFVNVAIALSLIGWYSVISNEIGLALQQFIESSFGLVVPIYVTVIATSLLMIYVTARGFTGIDRLALILVPAMLAFILYAAFQSYSLERVGEIELSGAFSFQTAVSAVIGSYIAGVIIQPDYSRFAASTRGAIWSVFIALAVVFPVVMMLSAMPAMATGNSNLMVVMGVLGLAIPAFILLFIAGWSSNVLCLYSSGLSIATMNAKASFAKIIVGIGILGTTIALIPAQSYLIDFLLVLGVIIPPIGAIYVVNACFIRRFVFDLDGLTKESRFDLSMLAVWAGASAFGFSSQMGIVGITQISSMDSLIFALLACSVVAIARRKGGNSVSAV